MALKEERNFALQLLYSYTVLNLVNKRPLAREGKLAESELKELFLLPQACERYAAAFSKEHGLYL